MKTFRTFNSNAQPKPHAFCGFSGELAYQEAPWDLEIGCGVGWHSITYAKNHPERYLFAIEKTRDKTRSFQNRMFNNQKVGPIKNLQPIHADAVSWISHSIPENRLSRIYILYPNLELKAPSKRFLRMPFFSFLITRLSHDGEIHLSTNSEAYAIEARKLAVEKWNLNAQSNTIHVNLNPNFKPRTHFEKKYFQRGDLLWNIKMQKNLFFH